MTPRDELAARRQQMRVYQAEDRVITAYRDHLRLEDHDATVQWVEEQLEAAWFARDYWMIDRVDVREMIDGEVDVADVDQGMGAVTAHSRWYPELRVGDLSIGRDGRNKLVVTHELAHVLVEARYPRDEPGNGHNARFARTMLETTYRTLGSNFYLALYEAYQDWNVDADPRRDHHEHVDGT